MNRTHRLLSAAFCTTVAVGCVIAATVWEPLPWLLAAGPWAFATYQSLAD